MRAGAGSVDPIVVEGSDFKLRGCTIDFAVKNAVADAPVILVVNEFDKMVSYSQRASRAENSSESVS